MLYSQSPPLAENETAPEDTPRGFARHQADHDEPTFGRRGAGPAVQAYPPLRPRSSLGRRMFRRVFRFAIVLLLGIGATLGWQAYGDTAKQMFATYVPEYAWLLSYLPGTKPPAPVAAVASPTLQLEPLAANLEFVRRSVEQLALKQDQLARNIAALQAVDEDIRQKISAPSPAAAAVPALAQPMAAIPQPKPAPPKPPAPAAPRPSSASGPLPIAPQR